MRYRVLLLLAMMFPATSIVAEDDEAPTPVALSPESPLRVTNDSMKDPPVLECEPAEISNEISPGRRLHSQLIVTNAGGGLMNWSLHSKPSWVTADADGGWLGPGQIHVIRLGFNTSLLSPGPHKGEIVIRAGDAQGSPFIIPVDTEVREVILDLKQPDTQFLLTQDRQPWQLGVRAGYLAPLGEREDQASGVPRLTGELRWRNKTRWGLGGGVDLLYADSVDGNFSSVVTGFRGDVFFDVTPLESPWSGYLLAGPEYFLERAEDEPTDDTYYNEAIGLNAGLGFSYGAQAAWDVRAEFTLLLESENTLGFAGLTLGWHF